MILRTRNNRNKITFWMVSMPTWSTRQSIIFLYNFQHIFVCLIRDTILYWFNFSRSWVPVITVQTSVVLVGIILVICCMLHHSSWASTLWTTFERFVTCVTDWCTFAQTVYIWKYFSYRRAVFHIPGSFFSRLVIRIKRPIVNTGELIVIWWIFSIRWVSAWACNTHMLACLLVCLKVRIMTFTFDTDLFKCLCSCMSINCVFIINITVLLFIPVVITTLILSV